MLKQASRVLKISVKEVRSRLTKLANRFTGSAYKLSQSEAWKYAWSELGKLIAGTAPRRDGFDGNVEESPDLWTSMVDILDRIRKGDTAFTPEQIARVEAVYARLPPPFEDRGADAFSLESVEYEGLILEVNPLPAG
ncbi:MAG: hypothetical protein V3T31_06235 [candidate division Zixibacteria bacterium]